MNTSSKYANLPFIASGERDVFESDDLPEADQASSSAAHHQQHSSITDASIEIIPTGTGDAFQKFASYDLVGQQSIRSGVTWRCCFHFRILFFNIPTFSSFSPNQRSPIWPSLTASRRRSRS